VYTSPVVSKKIKPEEQMKLGIMQPYFFPYLGYFQLMKSADHFIFFDTPQYERRGWMNRNRIINIREGSSYITVPVVKAPQDTSINKILIDESQDWRGKIISQLEIYKKIAPYYNEALNFFKNITEKPFSSIADLNIASAKGVFDYVGLPLSCDVFSEMQIEIDNVTAPDEWALMITKALGYSEYVNAPGGKAFFDPAKYDANGIKLSFINPTLTPYVQRIGRWESGLSILDVMMYNSAEKIREMLDDYTLE
jgi:hypothetical protein